MNTKDAQSLLRESAELEAFANRWEKADGTERANYQLFLTELCELLSLPKPDPAGEDTRDNAYVFERRVTFQHGDGSESYGFIDLFRRKAFVLEAKRVKKVGKGFDDAMLQARSQAEQYARALPASEGRPPFLIVVDVGKSIELYAEFSGTGGTYIPFPDPQSHRIGIKQLVNDDIRQRVRDVWLDPLNLDPTKRASIVTRDIAATLAVVARSLEASGNDPAIVANFLSRCLFTFFAEDVGLLPKRSFANLLEYLVNSPAHFVGMVGDLWSTMDGGGFAPSIRAAVMRFNGKFFKSRDVIALNRDQIALLSMAAHSDWRQVEPSIFGTLLERALDPVERRKLGAHYTPRAYVERLVLPTIMDPLREEWRDVQTAALVLGAAGKVAEAQQQVRGFHTRLCAITVLDPACGSGNFLYVALEHMKRLEGEVLNQLADLGDKQTLLELAGVTVDPHQFLGIEINTRAASVAELVLWIGFLQWHFRTRGEVMPPEPVIKDFHNIENRDAVLSYDRIEAATDNNGTPITRWDGTTYIIDPISGKDVPDNSARVPQMKFINPKASVWPKVDFIVGNPPFVGNKRMREVFGDGYVEALRTAIPAVPESSDYVMYWWNYAANLTSEGVAKRAGLITTQTIRQTFNRRVVEKWLAASAPISLRFAVPDHPWVDNADGAAVRIAMTVVAASSLPGSLLTSTSETSREDGEIDVVLSESVGTINADLTIGTNVTLAKPLRGNQGICWQGVKLVGDGFLINATERTSIEKYGAHVIKPFISNRDFVQKSRDLYAIDFFGLSDNEAMKANPLAFQRVHDLVKPERDENREPSRKEKWWLYGRSNENMRRAIASLNRFVITPEVAKHRPFGFAQNAVPDASLYVIAVEDAALLAVLSSTFHAVWARALGGHLEDRPRYHSSRCFDTYPFPLLDGESHSKLAQLGSDLDEHRRRQQTAHPQLTLTAMYNVLEKIRAGEVLTDKERVVHAEGLVSLLRRIHDDIDRATLVAYGWDDLLGSLEAILGNTGEGGLPSAARASAVQAFNQILVKRLLDLNAQRTADEESDIVRWLRPEYQAAEGISTPLPGRLHLEDDSPDSARSATGAKLAWPKTLAEQARAAYSCLEKSSRPMTAKELAAKFKGARLLTVEQLLDALVSLGRARSVASGVYVAA